MGRLWLLKPPPPVQIYSPVSGYNRICRVMNSSTNLNMFPTLSALWKWTMTDKQQTVNMLHYSSRQEGRDSPSCWAGKSVFVCLCVDRVKLWTVALYELLFYHVMLWLYQCMIVCVYTGRRMSATLKSSVQTTLHTYCTVSYPSSPKSAGYVLLLFVALQCFNSLQWRNSSQAGESVHSRTRQEWSSLLSRASPEPLPVSHMLHTGCDFFRRTRFMWRCSSKVWSRLSAAHMYFLTESNTC